MRKAPGAADLLARVAREAAKVKEDYGAGDELMLGGYLVLLGVYQVGLAGVLADRTRPGRENWTAGELALLAIATHKLSRIVTRDWVTAPLRAPFTRYQDNPGSGEVNEESRGGGLRQAVGDLLTCPYCIAPWIATALLAGTRLWPRPTRRLMTIFAAVAGSDLLNVAYESARSAHDVLGKRADAA